MDPYKNAPSGTKPGPSFISPDDFTVKTLADPTPAQRAWLLQVQQNARQRREILNDINNLIPGWLANWGTDQAKTQPVKKAIVVGAGTSYLASGGAATGVKGFVMPKAVAFPGGVAVLEILGPPNANSIEASEEARYVAAWKALQQQFPDVPPMWLADP